MASRGTSRTHLRAPALQRNWRRGWHGEHGRRGRRLGRQRLSLELRFELRAQVLLKLDRPAAPHTLPSSRGQGIRKVVQLCGSSVTVIGKTGCDVAFVRIACQGKRSTVRPKLGRGQWQDTGAHTGAAGPRPPHRSLHPNHPGHACPASPASEQREKRGWSGLHAVR